MKRVILYMLFVGYTTWNIQGQQEFGPINTGAANFLLITPDARNAGMGGVGVALPESNSAIFYNAATALADSAVTASVIYTYTPWMRTYEAGYALHSMGGFYKINHRNAILAGFRYYTYPETEVTGWNDGANTTIRPGEWAIDMGYAREVTAGFSLSATLRYIHSDMGSISGAGTASAFSFDFGGYYQRDIPGIKEGKWSAGLQLSNIGSGLTYLNTTEKLPAFVKVGGSTALPFSNLHRLIISADFGCRLMPSEIHSLNISTGAEYSVMNHFMLRGGYHYGDKQKGDNSYATAGLGICWYNTQLDFCWIFAEKDNVIRNTFQLSVGYAF